MSNDWYPQDKKELDSLLEKFLSQKVNLKQKTINGIIIPHAGYEYSGSVAGKAYALLKDSKQKKAIILSPSHYVPLTGIVSHSRQEWNTPLGKIEITDNTCQKTDISQEHAIGNQVPFLQKLGIKEILPIMVGEITIEQAEQIAKQIRNFDGIIIISTDLSHFLPYDEAKKKDQETIKAIESLNSKKLLSIDNSACGIFPLLILIELCKLNKWKPKLIEYKNSGDIIGDKSRVVGYSSFFF